MLFQFQCLEECIQQSECSSVVISSLTTDKQNKCDLHTIHCHGSPGVDKEKWIMRGSNCTRGFSRFGTTDGCYRIAGEKCDRSTWLSLDDAEKECMKYGSNVHLAGIKYT